MAKVVVREEFCKGCEICISACSKGALALSEKSNSKGYYVVELINPEKCNSCTLCAVMCPDVVLEIHK